jgi:hypothetical protein
MMWFLKVVLQLRSSSSLGHQLLGLQWNQNPTWHPKYFCLTIWTKRSILKVMIGHEVLQLWGQNFASGDQDHQRSHHRFPTFNMPMYGQEDLYLGMFTYLPWSRYSPWIHYDESLYSVWTFPKSYICDRSWWPYQNWLLHRGWK